MLLLQWQGAWEGGYGNRSEGFQGFIRTLGSYQGLQVA